MNETQEKIKIPDQLRAFWQYSTSSQGRWIWSFLALAIYLSVMIIPLPASYTVEARRSLAVFGVAVFLWATNTLPLPVTGIVILALLPFSGAISQKSTYTYFGNWAVFFVLGVLILSSPIMRSGLSTRLALAVVSRFGKTQSSLLGAILGIGALMSCFIIAHAVAAMLFPIVLEVVRATGAKAGTKFGLAAFMAMAWGAVIGSNATLLGGARGPLALGILQNATGQTISFGEWTLWSMPVVIVLGLVSYGLLLLVMGDEKVSLKAAQKFLEVRNKQLGPISRREMLTAGLIVFVIVLWLTKGESWGLDTIAFLGVGLAFVLGIAEWREVEEDVNWGIIVMYGSAIALSGALDSTGATEAVTKQLLSLGIQSPTIIFVAVVLIALLLTEFMSNAATVAVLMPVALSLATSYGIDPRAITLGVVVPAGLGFMFPVSTPAIAIAVGSGYVKPLAVLRWGLWLDLIGCLLFLLMSKVYWPLVGLRW